MTWIKTIPGTESPEVAGAVKEAMAGYPGEYSPERRGERRLPPLVMNDSISASHSLIPAALKHMFAGFGALMAPDLPLHRRDHELIAATVSSLNRCFY
jgi:hypothetical protein